MSPLLRQILIRGLIVIVVLGIAGYAFGVLAQNLLGSQNADADMSGAPVRAAAIFAGGGFALLVVLELLASGFRSLRGKKPQPPKV